MYDSFLVKTQLGFRKRFIVVLFFFGTNLETVFLKEISSHRRIKYSLSSWNSRSKAYFKNILLLFPAFRAANNSRSTNIGWIHIRRRETRHRWIPTEKIPTDRNLRTVNRLKVATDHCLFNAWFSSWYSQKRSKLLQRTSALSSYKGGSRKLRKERSGNLYAK